MNDDALVDEPNPKHKPGRSPATRGSRCPPDVDAEALLRGSEVVGGKRFATDGDRAFCAQEHEPGRWHGYPVSWDEVPPPVVSRWVDSAVTTRALIRRAKRAER